MCGIAGELHFEREGALSIPSLTLANDFQERRGPDGSGLFQLGHIALAHRRLKIFDLSDQAAQPMIDHELGLSLVFNGAIYNFRELREELKQEGYRFLSDGDTEVLLKAYHAWGRKAIGRLRGMFAFAIWERETDQLIIARDRMGIKPLYYAATPAGFKFASTLPALLQFEKVDTSIDREALHYYLTFHAVPEPLTLLKGVRKLKPGTVMTIHADGEIEQEGYWQLQMNEANTNHTYNEKDWLEATREALMIATDRQLTADVPVGVLLSGGLDSSLLVALASQIGGQKVDTFSIGFESARGQKGDEFYYSDMVSSHFNTNHHQMFISTQTLTDSLADCVASMSEPMISHDNIGFYLLAHEVSKHVKVVLSGQGADEIFAGYSWFQHMPHEKTLPEQSANLILGAVADNTFDEYLNLVTPEYRVGNMAHAFLTEFCKENGSWNPVDHMLAYESSFALSNGPLGRVDNMTMAASLEARVPFLDEAVIDVATAMPLRYKLPDGGKYILKQLGRQMLPHEVVDRPKGYFPVPALTHLTGSTRELMHDLLTPRNVKARGLFDPEAIHTLLNDPRVQKTPTGASRLWQIGMLEFWLQLHGI